MTPVGQSPVMHVPGMAMRGDGGGGLGGRGGGGGGAGGQKTVGTATAVIGELQEVVLHVVRP